MKKTLLGVGAMVMAGGMFAAAQQGRPAPDPRSMGGGDCAQNPYNCKDAANPLPKADTVWLEEMTWMDVRDAMAAGKTTVIIPTGGYEPNGPWLVLGKHNYVLQANCDAIARKMGNALCAPIDQARARGRHQPAHRPHDLARHHHDARGHLPRDSHRHRGVAPGARLQADLLHRRQRRQPGRPARGGRTLNAKWAGKALIAHIQEYYDYGSVATYMETKGLKAGKSDNMHDDPIITLNMFIDDPKSVRFDERVKAGKATINGVDISNKAKNAEWAKHDRRLPRRAHRRGDQQGHRQQGHAACCPAPPAGGVRARQRQQPATGRRHGARTRGCQKHRQEKRRDFGPGVFFLAVRSVVCGRPPTLARSILIPSLIPGSRAARLPVCRSAVCRLPSAFAFCLLPSYGTTTRTSLLYGLDSARVQGDDLHVIDPGRRGCGEARRGARHFNRRRGHRDRARRPRRRAGCWPRAACRAAPRAGHGSARRPTHEVLRRQRRHLRSRATSVASTSRIHSLDGALAPAASAPCTRPQ